MKALFIFLSSSLCRRQTTRLRLRFGYYFGKGIYLFKKNIVGFFILEQVDKYIFQNKLELNYHHSQCKKTGTKGFNKSTGEGFSLAIFLQTSDAPFN